MFRFSKVSILSLALFSACSVYAADSAEKLFNPHPDKEDVVLSMPCDRMMVFRKVYTSTDPKKIKDKNYNAGSAQNKSPMAQNPHLRYVQGAFHDQKGYYFLMAKYELMAGQYDALLNQDKCENLKLNKMSRLPKVKISYFDAVNASHLYSLYLQKAKDAYSEGKHTAYARLATDDEWEFASRGGNAVTQSQFEANLPPMENNDVSLYAWHDGPQSANGKLQLTGLKKPNPLGLYDMLGNAQEMTLEPFKAVRTGRLLGLPGGICVRGGSYLTPKDSLSSSIRMEKPLYVNGLDLTAADTSTRFVLSLPVASNTDEVKALNADVESLGDADSSESQDNVLLNAKNKLEKVEAENKKVQENFKQETSLLKQQNTSLSALNSNLEKKSEKLEKINSELLKLNDKLSDSNNELTGELKSLKDQIITANAQTEAMKEVAAAANLRLGGFLCKSVNDGAKTLEYQKNLLNLVKKQCEESKNRCQNYETVKSKVSLYSSSLDELLTYYGDTMANARQNYSMKIFKKELPDAKQAFGANSKYDDYVDTYYRHLDRYKNLSKDAVKNHQQWTSDCVKVGKGK